MRQKGLVLLPIAIIITLVGVVGYLVYQNTQLQNNIRGSTSPTTVSTTSSPQPTLTPSAIEAKLYLFKFKLKSSNNLPPIPDLPDAKFNSLSDYLSGVLGLPSKSISNLTYDTRSPSPYGQDGAVWSLPFYAILNQPVRLNDTYTDQYLTVYPQVVDDAILPYLIKADYCEKDSDCSVRANMCTLGAFNYYQKYQDPPWGCGPAGYKPEYSWYEYGVVDEKLNCAYELKFDGAKCTNNQCTETGFKKVCIDAI
ncbi:MAG: hypothetical protein HYV90_03855 [Candidatus Woesebacteria bacterium]|nr:MAG: hypothetical protein HYV90_03855 [Candidatus Woesebacteria bacterium]